MCALNKARFPIVLKNETFLILQLANRCTIALNQETILLLHPFDNFEHSFFKAAK